jgi:hypothetical protein
VANYNSGKIYNKMANAGGALYNSATYIVTFKLNDFFNAGDAVTQLLAISIVYESPSISDAVRMSSLYMLNQELRFSQEQASAYALFRVTDSLGITDAISAMIAALLVADRFSEIDSISRFAALLQTEEAVSLNQIDSVRAFINKADTLGFSDLASLFNAVMSVRDIAYATDNTDPKTAIADFIIGDPTQVGWGDRDAAFDWIMPFGLMVDWSQSVIPRAPEAESDEIQIAGVDGETLENTRYRNRQFKVVAWSEDDLSQSEKDALVRQITEILDATKNQTKKLTFARTDISFDVKYDGELVVEEGPSFVRAIIPLSASAYGRSSFDKEISGSGLIQNSGIARVGVINRIAGECENPSFSMGDVDISWAGTVPANSYLYIDHGKEVCYLEDSFGNKTNARQYLTGEFIKIPVGGTIIITANDCTEQHLTTTWYDKFLW